MKIHLIRKSDPHRIECDDASLIPTDRNDWFKSPGGRDIEATTLLDRVTCRQCQQWGKTRK